MPIFKKQDSFEKAFNNNIEKSEKKAEYFARKVLADGLKRVAFADESVFKNSRLYFLYMGNSLKAMEEKQKLKKDLLSLLPISSKKLELFNESKFNPNSLSEILYNTVKGFFLPIFSGIEAVAVSDSVKKGPVLNAIEGIINFSIASAFAFLSIVKPNIVLQLASLYVIPNRILVGWNNLKFAFHKKTKDLVWELKFEIENRELDNKLKFYERINKKKSQEENQNPSNN